MKIRDYNETADDADFRPKSVWSDGRLNTNENLLNVNLKRAHDAYDRQQEKQELALLGIDMREIEDE